ncbi:MAG: 16S rRNA (uracil(1498)-N(3))-methyltransferase [Desulfovibrionaceae bacterium]|nr:16S rRNA (uracil(1498)-N(3))-methyltransferase [Desulfovibrionaceae bacterium]
MRAFYLEPARWQKPFYLAGAEARHLRKVLRLEPGERILLLDGQGRSGEFSIERMEKQLVRLEAVSISAHPQPAGRIFLAAAYTRAARRSFMLEKAVELEAGGIWFWQAEHSQALMPSSPSDHWREQILAGSKQSLNPWPPELKTLPGGAQGVCTASERFSRRFLLWEEAGKENLLSFTDLSSPEDTIFAMGPEGGLSEKEVAVFQCRGFKTVSLGQRILRWETAAVLCMGLAWWASQNKNEPDPGTI